MGESMTGILLLFLLGLWIALLRLIVLAMMKSIKPRRVAVPVSIIFSILFMCLPVGDEVVGGIQFLSLCSNNRLFLGIDEEQLRNKTVIYQGAKNTDLSGYILSIRKQYWSYTDPDTGKVVISWNVYRAKGGTLIRTLGISETNSPLIFNGVCYPDGGWPKIFKNLNITEADRR